MPPYDTLMLTIDQRGVATLTLNRPDKHNALSQQMIEELSAAIHDLAEDKQVRVIVLAAKGKSFCAGGDLSWMQAQVSKNQQQRKAASLQLAHLFKALDEAPKFVIAKVTGPVYGGGIGLLSVCDYVLASDDCSFALSETRLGLIPATIGPYVLRRIGETGWRQAALNAQRFNSAKALELGLVSSYCAAEHINSQLEEQIQACLQCAPGAVAMAKHYGAQLSRTHISDPLDWSADTLAQRWESEEAQKGINAFLAKEKIAW